MTKQANSRITGDGVEMPDQKIDVESKPLPMPTQTQTIVPHHHQGKAHGFISPTHVAVAFLVIILFAIILLPSFLRGVMRFISYKLK